MKTKFLLITSLLFCQMVFANDEQNKRNICDIGMNLILFVKNNGRLPESMETIIKKVVINKLVEFLTLVETKEGAIRLPFKFKDDEKDLRLAFDRVKDDSFFWKTLKFKNPELHLKLAKISEDMPFQNGLELRAFVLETISNEGSIRKPKLLGPEAPLHRLLVEGRGNERFIAGFAFGQNSRLEYNLPIYWVLPPQKKDLKNFPKFNEEPNIVPDYLKKDLKNYIIIPEYERPYIDYLNFPKLRDLKNNNGVNKFNSDVKPKDTSFKLYAQFKELSKLSQKIKRFYLVNAKYPTISSEDETERDLAREIAELPNHSLYVLNLMLANSKLGPIGKDIN
jgi:hypothetical protein